jgi:CubicO group peptidase (beta-lactamase class C family)
MGVDFSAVDAALRQRIEREELAGVSYAVLRGTQVVARQALGWADREQQLPLREDHLFRAFSNTKLVTCCAALQLVEQGRIGLDDPVGEYIPGLRELRVLRPGAASLADTEPLREPVRLRHLLTHTAGFTYPFLEPQAPISAAYLAARTPDPALTLAQMMDGLAGLPLLFQPGTDWNYSVAIDVVGRVIEIVAGEPLDRCLQRLVLEPLGLHDTFFFVPEGQAGRLAPMYMGDLQEPSLPGLQRADHLPFPGAFLQRVPRLNPGGGLVTSLGDFTSLVAALAGGGAPLLRPQSLRHVVDNQLRPGLWIGFPGEPRITGRGHSFACSVTVQASAADPSSEAGDLQWGGMAGTHWWISPSRQLAAVLMTQRYMGYGLPFWTEFKGLVRAALAADAPPRSRA